MSKKYDDDMSWMGWIGFAAFMLMLAGVFSGIAGFVALFQNTVVYNAGTSTLWALDFTQWGWIHILAGILLFTAAGSLLYGHMYGRIIAIFVASLSAIANMVFIPVYPFWSILVIIIDIMVIYAVSVHGGKLKED